MVLNIFSPQFRWSRYLAWARVLLGFSALSKELADRSQSSFPFSLAIALFIGYALLVAGGGIKRAVFGLLALFADTVFLLIVTNHSAGHTIWFPSVFYLFLLTEAVAFYSPREVFMVVAICAGFCASGLFTTGRALMTMMLRPVLVAGTLAVGFAVNKRRLQSRIDDLAHELDATRESARKIGEAERQKIAADFHDGPLQTFISLQMRLTIVRKLLERDRDAGMQDLEQLQELALGQVRDLRSFVRTLRGPVDVDATNLFVSARRLADTFQKESGIPVTFVGADTPLAISPEVSLEVLQMLREALNNVQKHSGATRVAIAVARNGDHLAISVDDNGKGFPFSGTYKLEELEMLRLGPASIKRRARAVNADLMLESRPGRGAGVKLRIPL